MANNNITLNRSAILAQELVGCVNATRDALTRLNRVRDIMSESTDGVTFGTIEDLFGATAGKGAALQTLVNGARNAVQSQATSDFINRVT